MSNIETSIIIRTFNEEKHLGRLLESILQQNYSNWEIIIVDSGSTDNTLEIATNYPVTIMTIEHEDFSFGYSLNVGCKKAKGEYLVIVSAHSYPIDNTWLYKILQPFEDLKIGMVYGSQIGADTTKFSEERDFARVYSDKSKILVEEAFGNNANSAIRKSLWSEIPFDEELTGLEDVDWAKKIQRMGYYIYYKADATIVHIHNETYKQIYNRFKREMIAYKKIFPQYNYTVGKGRIDCIKFILKDIYYGLSEKYPYKKIVSAIPYRFAQYRGNRDGFYFEEKITPQLKDEFYYPEQNWSIVIYRVNQHKLENKNIPMLEKDEVLIKVSYVGVCSTDFEILEGSLDYYKSGWAKYPIIPGHEFSGVIAMKGEDVDNFKIGDKVVSECILGCGVCKSCLRNSPFACKNRREVGVLNFNGAYSQYMKINARFVHKLYRDAELKKACLIEPLAVSIRGIKKLIGDNSNESKKVAVLGAGTIGNLCTQLLSAKGYKITVFDKVETKIEVLKSKVINGYKEIDGLNDFDYIVEATGKTDALKRAIYESKAGAKILLLGLPYSEFNFNFESIVCSDKTIIGSVGSTKEDFSEAIKTYSSLDLDNLTQHVFPLDNYKDAWEMQKKGEILKAIIKVN